MNQPFLDKVAEHIFQNYSEKVSDLTIVLPNKRAGLFLKKFLAEKFKKTIWSPKIYSIEDFISELSGLSIPEPVNLIFELYHIYKKVEGENAQTPEEFIRWANVLLNDFNEIDLYCANGNALFSYLNELRAIEQWNPQTRNLSEFQKQYLRFWNSLGILYKNFSEHLLQKKQAYQGLAYKLASENLKFSIVNIQSPILFVGFNALTKSEEIIIDFFLQNKNAEIFWDADKYYVEDPLQEAGKFLRKNKKEGRSKSEEGGKKYWLWDFDILKNDSKEIEIIGVSGNVTQTKVAGEILADKNLLQEKTAVVLADETLLLPMLNSLPENVESVNVTMGFPLKNSPLHDFWNSLFLLQENASSSNEEIVFYHKHVIQILSHPFFNFSEKISALSAKIISVIKRKNRIYISGEELTKEFANYEFLKNLFSDWKNNSGEAIEAAQNLIKERIAGKNFESEFLARYLEIFNQIQSLQKAYNVINDLSALRIIFNSISGNYKAPFSGEPLKGLQIMGVLETRTLDFENVILLSANEDVLPSGKSHNSFLPYDVKKEFGLPTYSDRDAIFAYHFYRLIQRAKKIFLLYNNDNSKSFGTVSNEKSRFITQIQEELPKINPNIKITEKIISFPVSKKERPLKIEKSDEIIKRLDELSEKGFSPSALNAFLNCPLDFYFKYIIGLREEKEVEETVEADKFGNFIHEALQNLYLPFKGKNISANDVLLFRKNSGEFVKDAFLKQFSERDLSSGKNLLSLKVAQKFVSSFLKKEIELLNELEKNGTQITILELENEFEKELADGKKIRGKVDRIDKIGNTIRIIDYKTGNVNASDLKIENAEFSTFKENKPKALQLMAYALIYSKENPENKISSGIISLQKISESFMPLLIGGSEIVDEDSLKIFENELVKIISAMYDTSLYFVHNEEAQYCEFCC